MRPPLLSMRILRLAAGPGLLFFSGCVTTAQQGLDFLLSPEAAGNIGAVSLGTFSGLVSLANLLAGG